MFCKYCGKPIPDGAKYCPDCGPGKRPPVSGLIQALRPEADPDLSDRYDPFTIPEYLAARASGKLRSRMRLLWPGMVLGMLIPSVLLILVVQFITITLTPDAVVTPGVYIAPFGTGLIPFCFGLLVCLRKSQKLAWIHLVVVFFLSPFMLVAPIAELIILSPLQREYEKYLRQWKAEHPGLLPD